jgi:uncharacterized protein YbjT (DUF2867 family)
MKITVIGATGTAGSRTVAKLTHLGHEAVSASRASGVDLTTGDGLRDALAGADAAVDASNLYLSQGDLVETHASAERHLVEACAAQGVGHLVVLSIAGIEKPLFDDFPYYLAKRAQERTASAGPVPATIVKSTQWHEFATNPFVATPEEDAVEVQDWLVQPVAVDAVAEVLVEAALGSPQETTRTIAGPEQIRLPDLTARLLERHGDPRPVRAIAPMLADLAQGVLLAPEAEVVGPDVEMWLRSGDAALMAPSGA